MLLFGGSGYDDRCFARGESLLFELGGISASEVLRGRVTEGIEPAQVRKISGKSGARLGLLLPLPHRFKRGVFCVRGGVPFG